MSKNFISIIGRPNVGKSKLFNKLTINGKSIVDNMDGVTRDYNVGHCVSSGFHWLITDTAGLNDEKDYIMSMSMSQTIGVIKNSSAILFMIDGRAGVVSEDEEWALWLRKNCGNKKIILVVNKCDTKKVCENIDPTIYKIGFDDIVFISAEHSIGIDDILNKIKNYAIEEEYDIDRNTNSIRIAIVGRPNSGKSTLVNNILKEDRMITGEIAGLTRDAIEIEHSYKNHKIIILDTAGLRKKSSIFADIEKMSATSTIKAIHYAHVVVLLVDALIGPSKQDLSILSIATTEGRGVILAVNKWDLVIDVDQYIRQLKDVLDKIGDIKNVIVFPISAIHDNANKLLDKIITIYESWNKRISTNLLNTWLQSTIMAHPPSLKRGKQVNLKFITQVSTRPPLFYISTNMPDAIDKNYERYLANSLYKNFDFVGTPLRLKFRK